MSYRLSVWMPFFRCFRRSGGIASWCACRKCSVGADAHIGPNREAGPFGGSAPAMAGLSASGGGLFTAEKSPKRAGGCGPRSPFGLRGVHPKERQCPGRYAPSGCPARYCLPLPGFARASGIGWPLRLQNFSLRPHQLPRNMEWMLHIAAFLRNLSICTVGARIARPCRVAASRGGYGSLKRPFAPPHPRLPLGSRGAVSRSETEGINRTRSATADTPSVMAPPCHLP